MGTWSAASFGNDAAADWVCDLIEVDADGKLEATLRQASDFPAEDYLDSWEACEAIAACEVVAAAGGRPWPPDPVEAPLASMDDEALEWTRAHPEAAELAGLALRALDRIVAAESELPDLWEVEGATADDHDWLAAIKDLRERLAPA